MHSNVMVMFHETPSIDSCVLYSQILPHAGCATLADHVGLYQPIWHPGGRRWHPGSSVIVGCIGHGGRMWARAGQLIGPTHVGLEALASDESVKELWDYSGETFDFMLDFAQRHLDNLIALPGAYVRTNKW